MFECTQSVHYKEYLKILILVDNTIACSMYDLLLSTITLLYYVNS